MPIDQFKTLELTNEISTLKEKLKSYEITMDAVVTKIIECDTKNAILTANIGLYRENYKKLKEAFDEQTKKFELKEANS